MKTLAERKDNVLFLVAYASLKHWNEPINTNNIEAEKSRIERIAEQFFIKSNEEYNTFIINWVKNNAKKLVYTNDYVYDVHIPDDSHETNVNLFMR